MDLGGILTFLHETPVGAWVRSSENAFPAAEVVHVIGIALLFGTIAIVDLRLIGVVGRTRPAKAVMKDCLPWTWLGFAIAASSGLLMFLSNAELYGVNTEFRIKMVLLALAGVNMLVFEFILRRDIAVWSEDPAAVPMAARLSAIVSIGLWISVVTYGRWVGFTLNASPFAMF